MTNLETRPDEIDCPPVPRREVEIIDAREVPLGGIRAMRVRRTLPAKGRPAIGPWCFVDHYGPDDVATTGGMNVAPHPHCGLATVSWLFRGEIEHRDSLGTRALVLPGELNLMTAGHGIAHSEVSTKATSTLHGAQLWLALPDHLRDISPSFQHHAPTPISDVGVTWRVLLGSVGGESSPITWHHPAVGAEIALGSGTAADVPLDRAFEHGVLVDTGPVTIDGTSVPEGQLVTLPTGRDQVRITAADSPGRVMLIGGAPMETALVMWWNFIGSSHEEIVAARATWQAEIGAADSPATPTAPRGPRFGAVLGYDGSPIPAPPLPGGRLHPRRTS